MIPYSAPHFPVFDGFEPGKPRTIALPTAFFTDLLPLIDDVDELKFTLFAFYAVQQREGRYRYLRHTEIIVSDVVRVIFGRECALDYIETLVARTCVRGTLLCAEVELYAVQERLYFINAEPGRRALEQIARGEWQPGTDEYPVEILPERPSVYQLYEENIGPLTPMIADVLRDAEKTYSRAWIEDAIATAVQRNARSWRFIQAVLERRQQEGKFAHAERQPQSSTRTGDPADGRRYISGKYAEFIEY